MRGFLRRNPLLTFGVKKMSYERIIEYLEAIKLEYPGGEVEEACDIVIEKLKKELEQTE